MEFMRATWDYPCCDLSGGLWHVALWHLQSHICRAIFTPPQLKDETKETAVWHLPTPEEGSQPQLAFIRKTVVFTVLCTEELTPLIPLHGWERWARRVPESPGTVPAAGTAAFAELQFGNLHQTFPRCIRTTLNIMEHVALRDMV